MAAGFLNKPGTKYGPCPACNHKDCIAIRKTANSICRICGKKIGYEVFYYQTSDGELVHATCLEEKKNGNKGNIERNH